MEHRFTIQEQIVFVIIHFNKYIMRQYTTLEQTDHLIFLEFPKPTSTTIETHGGYKETVNRYSIGELLSFLEEYVDDPSEELLVWKDTVFWYVRLSSDTVGAGYDPELINALYKYLVELKNEGVI